MAAWQFADLGLVWLKVIDADWTGGLRKCDVVGCRGCGGGEAADERRRLRCSFCVDSRSEIECGGRSFGQLFSVRRCGSVCYDGQFVEHLLGDGKTFDAESLEVYLSVQYALA